MKILITGGAGCIGLELVRYLHSIGHDITILDMPSRLTSIIGDIPKGVKICKGNILNEIDIMNAITDCKAVVHLAAELGVNNTENNPLACIDVNIIGTKKVLDIAVKAGIEKFVFASSSEVYGEPHKNPVSEEDETQGKTIYAITKLAGEELCKAYRKSFGINYVILRYFNTYGKYQLPKFVIPIFVSKAKAGLPITINGNGNQIRSYIYAIDTAVATASALFNDNANNQIINIGDDSNKVSLNKLVEIIVSVIVPDKNFFIIHEENFSDGFSDRVKEREIYNRWCSGDKALKVLGFRASVSLIDGIGRMSNENKFLV